MTDYDDIMALKEQIEATTATLQNTLLEQKELLKMAKAFRKDYDKLMDAVHYLSVMYGGSQEKDAIKRLEAVYTQLQNTWGG